MHFGLDNTADILQATFFNALMKENCLIFHVIEICPVDI